MSYVFLHLGGDMVVSVKEIVAILDLRTAGSAATTRDFLSLRQSQQHMTSVADQPKSLVLTKKQAFLSPISSLTLKKRADLLRGQLLTYLT